MMLRDMYADGVDLVAVAEELLRCWEYDLYVRRPGPALLEDGVFTPTDLDLAGFLSALGARGAVINIPWYKSARAATLTSSERVVSKDNRHGKVLALTGNQGVFSFSVLIQDMNVIKLGSDDGLRSDEVGAPRNFMLVDLDGTFRDEGWKTIEFHPTAKENAFLTENRLWTTNKLVFQNWVHPNRWISFYGKPYFHTKSIEALLVEEATWRRTEQKRLLAAGVTFSDDPKGEAEAEGRSRRKGVPRVVAAFEAELDFSAPAILERVPLVVTREALVANADRIHAIQQGVLPRLRLAIRLTELAFYQMIERAGGTVADLSALLRPAWVKGAWTEMPFKGNQKRWKRVELPHVGEGAAIRWRIYPKTETVAASAEDGSS